MFWIGVGLVWISTQLCGTGKAQYQMKVESSTWFVMANPALVNSLLGFALDQYSLGHFGSV